jgi:hypothetical protein
MLLKVALCKFSSFFLSLVNIYINVKQKFCSEIRVLHIELGVMGARRAVFLAKKRDPWLRTGFLTEIAMFLQLFSPCSWDSFNNKNCKEISSGLKELHCRNFFNKSVNLANCNY